MEQDPWGLPYKLVTKKLVGRRPIPGLALPGRMDKIVDTLFPRGEDIIWPAAVHIVSFPEVTIAEIKELAGKIPAGKAPGPDGVPDLVIKGLARN